MLTFYSVSQSGSRGNYIDDLKSQKFPIVTAANHRENFYYKLCNYYRSFIDLCFVWPCRKKRKKMVKSQRFVLDVRNYEHSRQYQLQ